MNKLRAHERFCKCNPNYEKEQNFLKENGYKSKFGERSHESKIEREKTRSDRPFICKSCGKTFYISMTDTQYEYALKHPKSKHVKKTCSSKCAHHRENSKSSNDKRRKSVKKYWNSDKGNERKSNSEYNLRTCKNCGKLLACIECRMAYYCSQKCKDEYHEKRKNEMHDRMVEQGKRVAAMIQCIRRSKNEMLFCKLCEENFSHVENNKPIFNGWDADVLIYDFKIAVLWNGKWHYEQVMKNQKSSLKQIQNRDKIKVNEILKCGWVPYIVKDMGKYNESFVQERFEEFKKFLSD